MKTTIVALTLAASLPLMAMGKPAPFLAEVNYKAPQKKCLALNVYHEAKNQSPNGQIAVAWVTLNRVKDKSFPNTTCGVIKQAVTWKGYPVRHQCQFSWFCDGKSDVPRNRPAWELATDISESVLGVYGLVDDPTKGATHYHAKYVSPRWAKAFKRTASFDVHLFYVRK